jgi:hypothetical protein
MAAVEKSWNRRCYRVSWSGGLALRQLSRGLTDDLKISDDGVLSFSVFSESLFALVRQICSDLVDGF